MSEALAEDEWAGRTGLVHEAVLHDFATLAAHQVYASGAPVMVEAAHRDFIEQRKLPPEEFYSDAFTFSFEPKPLY